MMRVRLRRVVTDADFRYGIRHHVDALRAARKLPAEMDPDECVLLVSRTQLQLAFVFPEIVLGKTRTGIDRAALSHYRVQLNASTPWNPIMLSEYAGYAGIEIVGLRKFEAHLGAELAKLRAAWSK